MRGQIIGFDPYDGTGVIRSEAGPRYRFARSEVLGSDDLLVGAEVDFEARDDLAQRIVVLQRGEKPVQSPDPWAVPQGRFKPIPAETLVGYFVRAVTVRYADFKTRARRTEYWSFILFSWLTIGVPLLLGQLLDEEDVFGLGITSSIGALLASGVAVIALLGLLVPNVAVAVRRMHDTGRSGWAVCLTFLPYVGALIFVILACLPSQNGVNKFGPPPLR